MTEPYTEIEKIAGAAVLMDGGLIVSLPPPARHHHCMHWAAKIGQKHPIGPDEQGFITNRGRYVGRIPALRIARAAGQIVTEPVTPHHGLFSEDVW